MVTNHLLTGMILQAGISWDVFLFLQNAQLPLHDAELPGRRFFSLVMDEQRPV